MPRDCCHISLAFVLKFCNFLQAFVGVSIILHSVWMLDQWSRHIPFPPTPPAPSPSPSSSPSPSALSPYSSFSLNSESEPRGDFKQITELNLAVKSVSGFDIGLEFHSSSLDRSDPWFIYSYLGLGIIICCITFIGCIAAEAINGCCLCSYTLLIMVLILVEGALVAFIAIDHQWEKDLPIDPTGELEKLRSFIRENIDICKWVGITVIIIQASSLLLALILKSMASSRKDDYDCEDDYNIRRRTKTHEPLLNPQSNQTSRAHSDIWSSLMREKYGLNDGDKYNTLSQSSSTSVKTR